jgi:hypothetical protein
VAWTPSRELAYTDWVRHGNRLGVAGRSSGWWIGDWVRYGAARYGRRYVVAVRVTGYDDQTLMNMVYVASRFDISRRRENLSWSHHAELAAMEPGDQERWLDQAAAERLSVRALRRELLAVREACDLEAAPPQSAMGPSPLAAPEGEAPGHAEVATCPACGHRFAGPVAGEFAA